MLTRTLLFALTLLAVARAPFGKLPDGSAVDLFTLTNARGIEARIMTYGGTLVSLKVPDRQGRLDDVVLGFDRAEQYAQKNVPYFGLIGRYGNRIAKGRFTLDGKAYTLATNNGANHLHGGVRGFDKVMWRGEQAGNGVALSYTSKDGEEGYPGTLKVKVTYTLTDKDELVIEYEATTDKPTIVNLTEHSHFNLAGPGRRDILNHALQIDADRYTPVDDTLIPTGELARVADTPFDFRRPTWIGERIEDKHPQLVIGHGYDHNWVLNGGPGLKHAVWLSDPESGRTMDIFTTEPGIQFYSGNFLDGTVTGKQGQVYRRRFGLCLEPQHFPDSPNKSSFPSTVLRPGETYKTRTVYRFGVQR